MTINYDYEKSLLERHGVLPADATFAFSAGSATDTKLVFDADDLDLSGSTDTVRWVWLHPAAAKDEGPWDDRCCGAKDDKIQDELRGIAGHIDSLKDDLPCSENQGKAKQSADLLREIADEIDQVEKYQDLLGGPCPF